MVIFTFYFVLQCAHTSFNKKTGLPKTMTTKPTTMALKTALMTIATSIAKTWTTKIPVTTTIKFREKKTLNWLLLFQSPRFVKSVNKKRCF